MTAATTTLAAWLLEQIAADEEWARDAEAGKSVDPIEWPQPGDPDDPAHILAVCEAHRRIVAEHVEDEGACRMCQWDRDCDQPVYTHDDDPAWLYPCPTLRALAAVYRDHEDWRVSGHDERRSAVP